MRGKMLKEYLKTIFFAVIASVVISIVLCYFIFFSDIGNQGNDRLQDVINGIEEYVSVEEGMFVVDEEVLDKLKSYNSWIQIMDEYGFVIYSAHVPQNIPNAYSNFALADSVQGSNKIPGYTLYTTELSNYPGYGVVIGCDSEVIGKYYINIEGSSSDFIFKCLIVFLITMIIVIICATLFYSQKITSPIATMLNDIGHISKGERIVSHTEQGIFENVFSQLNVLQETLNQNDKLRAEWITNISHDIRTPLSAIRGYAEVIASENYVLEKGEIQEFAKEILKSEAILEGLVDDLKISNNLIEGKLVLKKETVDVFALMNEVVVLTNSLFMDKGTVCITGVPDAYVFCDRNLLKRSLFNIVSNAFVHNDSSVHVDISISIEQNYVVICIEDNGKGVTEEERKHLFDRYYRGCSSSETQGMGLGLAIAKEAIAAHGGEIEVTNREPNGIRFQVRLEKAAS